MSVVTGLSDRFVKLDEVKRHAGLGTSMIDRLIEEGNSPPPSSCCRSHRAGDRRSTSRAADYLLAFRADATGDDQHNMAA